MSFGWRGKWPDLVRRWFRGCDHTVFHKNPVLIIQLIKERLNSAHVVLYNAKSISPCSLGCSQTYVSVSWMGSHSLGNIDLIITAQPSRECLCFTATVLVYSHDTKRSEATLNIATKRNSVSLYWFYKSITVP